MSKEKTSSTQNKGNYPEQEVPEMQSSEATDYETAVFKKLYLPSSKAGYAPSEDSMESANDLKHLNSSTPSTFI